jgi:hypothetical protein
MSDDLFTTDETVTDRAHVAGSVDLNPDELRAVDGIITTSMPADPADTWRPPSSRPRTEPEYGSYITRIKDSIESWHGIATPQAVIEARAALDDAIEADQAARREFDDLPRRQAAEREAIGLAAVAGEVIPERLTDWERERVILLARHDVLARKTKAAGKAYAEAVKNSLSDWRDALVAAVEPARQEALRSFQGVQGKVDHWQAAIKAAHAVDAALHRDELPTTVDDETRKVIGEGKRASAALAALLNSGHPVASGAYLQRTDTMRPPLYAREAMAKGNLAAWTELMQLEIREQFKVTDFTREEARRYVPDAQGELRPRGPREDYTFLPDVASL